MAIAKNHTYTERSSDTPSSDVNENSESHPDQQVQNKINPPVLKIVVRENPAANATTQDQTLALPINASGTITLITRSEAKTLPTNKPVAENQAAVENNQTIDLLINPLTPLPQFLEAMQSARLNPNIQIASKHLLLHAADSHVDSDKKITCLLQMGADPNFIDAKGNSILMNATILGLNKLGLLLMAHGADCKISDNQYRNALHYAAILGNPELFQALIDKNSTLLTIKDKLKLTALDYLLTAPKDRRVTTLHLLKTNNINAARDENADHNFIHDKNGFPLEINKQRFTSNKEDGQKLMTLIKSDDENIACLQAQITKFKGRSLIDACLRQQSNIRGTYVENNNENSTCTLLNELLFTNKITHLKFEAKNKKFIPGFVDAVTILPSGQESVILKKIKEILPTNLLTRHYESTSLGKQFFAIEHIQINSHQQTLEKAYRDNLKNVASDGLLPTSYNDLLPEIKNLIFEKMQGFSIQDISSARSVNKAFYKATEDVMLNAKQYAINAYVTNLPNVLNDVQVAKCYKLLGTNHLSEELRRAILKNLCDTVNTYTNYKFRDAWEKLVKQYYEESVSVQFILNDRMDILATRADFYGDNGVNFVSSNNVW